MGEGAKGMIHGFSLTVMEDDNEFCESSSSSFYGDSDTELGEDETSSSQSSSSQLDSSFDLSLLMAELPIKRGLSKYFEGKSQSFRSLSDVRSLEDLAKEENPIRKKIKACRGSAGATQRPCNTPRIHGRTISKKGSSCASSLTRRNRSSSLLFSSSKLPALPLHKNLR